MAMQRGQQLIQQVQPLGGAPAPTGPLATNMREIFAELQRQRGTDGPMLKGGRTTDGGGMREAPQMGERVDPLAMMGVQQQQPQPAPMAMAPRGMTAPAPERRAVDAPPTYSPVTGNGGAQGLVANPLGDKGAAQRPAARPAANVDPMKGKAAPTGTYWNQSRGQFVRNPAARAPESSAASQYGPGGANLAARRR